LLSDPAHPDGEAEERPVEPDSGPSIGMAHLHVPMGLELQAGSIPEKSLLDQNNLSFFADPECIPDGGLVGGVDVLEIEEFPRSDRELEQNFSFFPALHPKEKRSRGLDSQRVRQKES
jgi:hypothetical protein